MGDRGAAADDAPDQGLQGDVETGEVWYDAEKLDVNVGASERTRTTARRDGPTSQGRPSDMPASVLHQVRQQQGILQQMPQMRPEVQVGSKSRRMGAFPSPSSSNILPIMDAPVKGKGKT